MVTLSKLSPQMGLPFPSHALHLQVLGGPLSGFKAHGISFPSAAEGSSLGVFLTPSFLHLKERHEHICHSRYKD